MIFFNKPYLSGKETEYIRQAVESGKISGDGLFTKKCHDFFENKYKFRKCLLTHSCTAALEMAALLIDTRAGDEIIMPSFTFVSTANAFVLRGAKIVFADSNPLNPNIDASQIEQLITPNTKAIVVVHYAGIACDMAKIKELTDKYHLFLIEDAAQSIDSYYEDKPLGSLGDFAAFSFHETKNIISGEGGMLVINNDKFIERAQIIREKGTNRPAFFRGETDKYQWIDIGSSYLPSEINAAFLFAQLENLDFIQAKRKSIWSSYYKNLEELASNEKIQIPFIPNYASNNAHIFYLLCKNESERKKLILFLNKKEIQAIFHYLPLHQSPFYKKYNLISHCPHTERYAATLLRLPLYYELKSDEIDKISQTIWDFYS